MEASPDIARTRSMRPLELTIHLDNHIPDAQMLHRLMLLKPRPRSAIKVVLVGTLFSPAFSPTTDSSVRAALFRASERSSTRWNALF
jgi:hypothetical protein